MVFFLAVSTKTALTLGAIIGGTAAVIANREKLMEVTAHVLQRGADILNEELNKHKIKMAASMEDGEIAFDEKMLDFGSEATTPEVSEYEGETDETDEDIDSETDQLELSFEEIKRSDLIEYVRYEGSSSTLIDKSGKSYGAELD